MRGRLAGSSLPWWGAIAAGLVLTGSTRGLPGGRSGEAVVRVLFPADKSAVESGQFDVLCVAAASNAGQPAPPRLRVDGKAVSWEAYKPPVLLSRVNLRPGRHIIVIGTERLRVHVRGDGEGSAGTPDWPLHKTHLSVPGCADCAACHQVSQQGDCLAVGEVTESSACSACHSASDFEAAHFHPQEPLASCRMCHALHGSSGPSLLRGPAKQLCAACHE